MEIHGRLGNVIGSVEPIYSKRDSPIGVVCSPSTVREVLLDSTLFRPEEIEHWTQVVRAPINRDIINWIMRTVRDEGLAFKSTGSFWPSYVAEPIHSEDNGPFKWGRKGTVIPEDDEGIWQGRNEEELEYPLIPSVVQNTVNRHETHLLYYPLYPNAQASSWPKYIYSSSIEINELPSLAKLLPLEVISGKQLLYRGDWTRRRWFHGLGFGQRPDWGFFEEDYGNGLYFTPDLDVAILYAGRGGIVQVVDFSDQGESLKLKTFDGEGDDGREWEKFVKGSLCFESLLAEGPPKRYQEDVLIGPICTNHEEVTKGGSPKRGLELQVVAKTDSACDYMSTHTVAVFYVV